MKEKTNNAILRITKHMKNTFWKPLIIGILFILLGILSIVGHSIIHEWTGRVIGLLTIIVGGFILFSAYRNGVQNSFKDIPRVIYAFTIALVLLGFIIMFSDKFMDVIVLIISIIYFITGLIELYVAINVSPYLGITGFLLNSFVSISLAVAVWVTWQNNPEWFIGFIIGVKLIFYGLSAFLMLWISHSKKHVDDIEVEILDDDA